MPTRASSGGLRLSDDAFQSEAPAYAEVARSLAGRAAELYELASGSPAAAGEGPLTRQNPQGLTGWDLSGPPWGSCILHPVTWFGGVPNDGVGRHAPDITSAWDRWYSANRPALIKLRFWNRAHERLGPSAVAPLGRLYWALRSYRIAGTGTPTATARTWNPRLGQRRDTGDSATFTTTASDTVVLSGTTLGVATHPGWNTVLLEISLDTSGHTSVITCGSLSVRFKRGQ